MRRMWRRGECEQNTKFHMPFWFRLGSKECGERPRYTRRLRKINTLNRGGRHATSNTRASNACSATTAIAHHGVGSGVNRPSCHTCQWRAKIYPDFEEGIGRMREVEGKDEKGEEGGEKKSGRVREMLIFI